MSIFAAYVAPRIDRAEFELENIRTRKIPYSIDRGDYERVNRLAERAAELQCILERLRAMENLSDGRIADALASF